jgi:hypothetical protein
MVEIIVCGDPARNKVQTLAGGAGVAIKEIKLPAKWDELMEKAGYRPLKEFYLKSEPREAGGQRPAAPAANSSPSRPSKADSPQKRKKDDESRSCFLPGRQTFLNRFSSAKADDVGLPSGLRLLTGCR